MREQPTAIDHEPEFSFEHWLDVELQKQYTELARALNEVGLLEIIEETGEKGIIGIDGKPYPIPSIEKIKAELLKDREIYELKMKQGFTKINLVPIALPIAKLIAVYKEQLLDHFKRGKLFYPTKDASNRPELIIKDKFNEKEPLCVWEKWLNADVDGSLKYYPKNFDKDNNGGSSKEDLMTELAKTKFSGWVIELIEDYPNIPREGKGKTKEGRKQLEAGLSPIDYKNKLADDQAYDREDGQTIDSSLTQATTELHTKNQVMDDFQGHGSINWLLGNYQAALDCLPFFYWVRGYRQAYFSRNNPRRRDKDFGFRSAVRVGRRSSET